jgi:hypothetical protein
MIGAVFYEDKLLKEMKKYYNIEDEKVLLKFLEVNCMLLQHYYQMID